MNFDDVTFEIVFAQQRIDIWAAVDIGTICNNIILC
jgi:hypothetical protein